MSTVPHTEAAKHPGKPKTEGWLHTRIDRALRKRLEIRAVEEETSVREIVEAALRKHFGAEEQGERRVA